MKLESEQDVINLIKNDPWMTHALELVESINLPDCWIGAGFVRSKVWDYLHEYGKRSSLDDVDVIYFDPTDISEATEKKLEEKLKALDTSIPWSVKNQARMHILANEKRYSSTRHAISHWPETATSVAVRISNNKLEILAPFGVEDLVSMRVNPTPHWEKKPGAYEARLARKNWQSKWPKIKVNHLS